MALCYDTTGKTNNFDSLFPRLLYWITIPVRKNAPLLQPTTRTKRWPVMIFSHGLGGSRNAYSHLVGSVASHGVIVICPEHRDGSSPISFVRELPGHRGSGEKAQSTGSTKVVDYIKISHSPSPQVEAARTRQLKIRLWELGCIYDSLLKLDTTLTSLTNLNTSSASLGAFADKMQVHQPGSITFAGHSFGAATVAQFVKTIYYSPQARDAPSSYEPLFSPSSHSAVVEQVTPNTPIVLLDMWCYPMRAKTTTWLWDKPMPCYAPSGPGGSAILAVESQAFVKWREHLKVTKRFLSHDPASDSAKSEDDARPPPHFYYPATSAHLSQSDFGVLFPWVTKKIFASEEPERVMKLNVRAVLQLLRERNIPVSATSREDMELGSEIPKGEEVEDDRRIFSKRGGIRGWVYLSTDANDMSDVAFEAASAVNDEKTSPGQAVVSGEVEKESGKADVVQALGDMKGTSGAVKA